MLSVELPALRTTLPDPARRKDTALEILLLYLHGRRTTLVGVFPIPCQGRHSYAVIWRDQFRSPRAGCDCVSSTGRAP